MYTCHELLIICGFSATAPVKQSELCTLTMQGAYPTLIIADVQGQGSANLLNKMKLWNMLSIDKWVYTYLMCLLGVYLHIIMHMTSSSNTLKEKLTWAQHKLTQTRKKTDIIIFHS